MVAALPPPLAAPPLSFWRRLLTLVTPVEIGLDILAIGALIFLTGLTRQFVLSAELGFTLLVDVLEAAYLLWVPVAAAGAGFFTQQRVRQGLFVVGLSAFFTVVALFLINFKVGLDATVVFIALLVVLVLITIQDIWTARHVLNP